MACGSLRAWRQEDTIPIHHRDTDGLGTTSADQVLTEAPS